MNTESEEDNMNNVSIIHCGDIHIGMELQGAGSKSRARKAEIKKTFLDIIALCRQEHTDLLLVAGDLFDGANTVREDMEDILMALSGLDHTRVFIAPGNHDFVNPASVYETCKWPENTHIFRGDMETVIVPKLQLSVSGAGFTSQYVRKSLLSGFKVEEDGLLHIGVLHGELVSRQGTGNYNPLTIADIEASGLDYLALGHIHRTSGILRAGETSYAYSGSPEGHGFDELGALGILKGTISREAVALDFYPVCKRRYEEVQIDVTGLNHSTAVIERILHETEAAYGPDFMKHFYKIILTGTLDSQVYLNLADIQAGLSAFYFSKVKDRTSVTVHIEDIENDTTLRGVFASLVSEDLKLARESGAKEEAKLLTQILGTGLKAFMGEVHYSEDTQN